MSLFNLAGNDDQFRIRTDLVPLDHLLDRNGIIAEDTCDRRKHAGFVLYLQAEEITGPDIVHALDRNLPVHIIPGRSLRIIYGVARH